MISKSHIVYACPDCHVRIGVKTRPDTPPWHACQTQMGKSLPLEEVSEDTP